MSNEITLLAGSYLLGDCRASCEEHDHAIAAGWDGARHVLDPVGLQLVLDLGDDGTTPAGDAEPASRLVGAEPGKQGRLVAQFVYDFTNNFRNSPTILF